MIAVEDKILFYQTTVDFNNFRYEIFVSLEKIMVHNEATFRVKELRYIPFGLQTNQTIYRFYYNENNFHMQSIQTIIPNYCFFHVIKTDWFDSNDGNIYYSVIEKKLGEDPNFDIFFQHAKQTGHYLFQYEKYEWRDIEHLPSVSLETENSDTYQKILQLWKLQKFILTKAIPEKNFKPDSLCIFPYEFDQPLKMHAIQYAQQQNSIFILERKQEFDQIPKYLTFSYSIDQ